MYASTALVFAAVFFTILVERLYDNLCIVRSSQGGFRIKIAGEEFAANAHSSDDDDDDHVEDDSVNGKDSSSDRGDAGTPTVVNKSRQQSASKSVRQRRRLQDSNIVSSVYDQLGEIKNDTDDASGDDDSGADKSEEESSDGEHGLSAEDEAKLNNIVQGIAEMAAELKSMNVIR